MWYMIDSFQPWQEMRHVYNNSLTAAAIDIDRLSTRRVLTLVVENQPHGSLADLREKLVCGLAHDAPPYSGKPGAVHGVDAVVNTS